MIGLDRIMEIPGVVAAGQFNSDGKVIRYEGDITNELADFAASSGNQINQNMVEFMESLAEKSKLETIPLTGWAVWGGKYAFCVVHNTGVIIETKRADFNQLIVDLFLPEATDRKSQYSGL